MRKLDYEIVMTSTALLFKIRIQNNSYYFYKKDLWVRKTYNKGEKL